MATISRFEDMLVWQKARVLTREVYKNLSLCRDIGFRDQIQRASVSVMSNIAEGFERGTEEEFLNYLYPVRYPTSGDVGSCFQQLIYYEACINQQDAYKREKYLKSGYGKRYIRGRLKRFLSLTG